MSLNFVEEQLCINGDGTDSTFTFFKKGFVLNGAVHEPTWQDVTVSGNNSLTLPNAKAGSPNYVKAYGACEQRLLPSGYTQLEYLKAVSNTNCQVDIAPNDLDQNFTIEIQELHTELPESGTKYMIASTYAATQTETRANVGISSTGRGVFYVNAPSGTAAWGLTSDNTLAIIQNSLRDK